LLDVHPPTEPVHGWRDFFIHLATITIGLLIALSMEGCVEWQHHRHQVHEAEAGLQIEIEANARKLQGSLQDVKNTQKELADDVAIMRRIIANPKVPNQDAPKIDFHLPSFSKVSWDTAKSTGTLSYMAYASAHEYADIYDQQDDVYQAELQAARDAMLSYAPFVNMEHVPSRITVDDAVLVKQRIEIFQAQLIMVESMIVELDGRYKKFLGAAHPE